MNDLLAQLILARRSFDDEGWMNILVVIVMAVIWLVGGIIKAMKTKYGEEQRAQNLPPSGKQPAQSRGGLTQTHARVQRPAAPATPARGQPTQQPGRRLTLADLRAAARRFAAEAEQAFQPKPQTSARRPRAQTTSTAPASARADVMAPPARITPPPVPAQRAAQPTSASEQLSGLLSDYRDPAKLRSAILHYEILGPPLSLRNE